MESNLALQRLVQVTLLAWHQTEEDILYKHLLDFYAKKKPNQLVVQYLLTKPRNSNYEHKVPGLACEVGLRLACVARKG